MLEYDEETYDTFKSSYSSGYAKGLMEGILIGKFNILKNLTKEYTDNQIRGIDPVEGEENSLLRFWKNSEKGDLLEFYRKYESISSKQLMNRYIAESEYLPWRGF